MSLPMTTPDLASCILVADKYKYSQEWAAGGRAELAELHRRLALHELFVDAWRERSIGEPGAVRAAFNALDWREDAGEETGPKE